GGWPVRLGVIRWKWPSQNDRTGSQGRRARGPDAHGQPNDEALVARLVRRRGRSSVQQRQRQQVGGPIGWSFAARDRPERRERDRGGRRGAEGEKVAGRGGRRRPPGEGAPSESTPPQPPHRGGGGGERGGRCAHS